MGKGDQKTRRGKIQVGSFGNVRPRNKAIKITEKKEVETVSEDGTAKKATTKKATTKKAS